MSRARMQMQFSDPGDHPCETCQRSQKQTFPLWHNEPFVYVIARDCRVEEKGLGKVVVRTVIKIQTQQKRIHRFALINGLRGILFGPSSVGLTVFYTAPSAWDMLCHIIYVPQL